MVVRHPGQRWIFTLAVIEAQEPSALEHHGQSQRAYVERLEGGKLLFGDDDEWVRADDGRRGGHGLFLSVRGNGGGGLATARN